jgi:hypothetical protein
MYLKEQIPVFSVTRESREFVHVWLMDAWGNEHDFLLNQRQADAYTAALDMFSAERR